MPFFDGKQVTTDTVAICRRLDELIALLREQMGKPPKEEELDVVGPFLNDGTTLYIARKEPAP